MVFKCQEDSFLKEFTSKVVSCKKSENDNYEIICENTVLFPEGGGQPSDCGFLNDQKVIQVVRKFDKAVHYVEHPIGVGEEVRQVVDWDKRFDHMQQHSGQHLITAVIDRELKFNTVSWYLGDEISYIELDTNSITVEQIRKMENITNQLIREGRKVTVQVFREDTPEEELENARSARGLPADHKGDIRVITIEGIESNMCCGTHVNNLSQLQVVKLLHSEKSKRKGQTLLYFQVGNRVINRLANSIEREQKLTALLKTNPTDHPEFVDKLIKNVKSLNKNLKNILKELAIYEAAKLKDDKTVKYYCLHKKEADADFMNIFIKELDRTDIFLFLSTGDEKGSGNIVLYGNETAISVLGNKICELLNGKGVGKGNRFQAKVANLSNRSKVEKLIQEYFN